jgi:hypothetical protein
LAVMQQASQRMPDVVAVADKACCGVFLLPLPYVPPLPLLYQLSMLQALHSQLRAPNGSSSSNATARPLELEAAGLVAAVDGSRCLLAMPDSYW